MSVKCTEIEERDFPLQVGLNLGVSVVLILWTLYCLYLQKRNLSIYQSRAKQTWVFFWTLLGGLLVSCGFACSYLFVGPSGHYSESLLSLLTEIDRCLSFVLVFTVPNVCVQITVFQFIVVICCPLHIKRYKNASYVCAAAVVFLSAAINVTRAIMYDDSNSKLSKVFYEIDEVFEICIVALTAALCVWFFVIYAKIHQRKEQINFITIADRGNKVVTLHLTICALVCAITDFTSLIISWIQPSWFCGWQATIFELADLTIYIVSLTVSFTPFLCQCAREAQGDDETSSLYETF